MGPRQNQTINRVSEHIFMEGMGHAPHVACSPINLCKLDIRDWRETHLLAFKVHSKIEFIANFFQEKLHSLHLENLYRSVSLV